MIEQRNKVSRRTFLGGAHSTSAQDEVSDKLLKIGLE